MFVGGVGVLLVQGLHGLDTIWKRKCASLTPAAMANPHLIFISASCPFCKPRRLRFIVIVKIHNFPASDIACRVSSASSHSSRTAYNWSRQATASGTASSQGPNDQDHGGGARTSAFLVPPSFLLLRSPNAIACLCHRHILANPPKSSSSSCITTRGCSFSSSMASATSTVFRRFI